MTDTYNKWTQPCEHENWLALCAEPHGTQAMLEEYKNNNNCELCKLPFGNDEVKGVRDKETGRQYVICSTCDKNIKEMQKDLKK